MLADFCFGPPAAVLLAPMVALPVLGYPFGWLWPLALLTLGAIVAALLAPIAAVSVLPAIVVHLAVMDDWWRVAVAVMVLQLFLAPVGAWVLWKAVMRPA